MIGSPTGTTQDKGGAVKELVLLPKKKGCRINVNNRYPNKDPKVQQEPGKVGGRQILESMIAV